MPVVQNDLLHHEQPYGDVGGLPIMLRSSGLRLRVRFLFPSFFHCFLACMFAVGFLLSTLLNLNMNSYLCRPAPAYRAQNYCMRVVRIPSFMSSIQLTPIMIATVTSNAILVMVLV